MTNQSLIDSIVIDVQSSLSSRITTKEETMKNVVFLAPCYPYVRKVIANLSSELDRKQIPYTASKASGAQYIRTNQVNVTFVYSDPVMWTPELFSHRDAVFGKKALVNLAAEKFMAYIGRCPRMSLSKYITEMAKNSSDNNTNGPIVTDKPKTSYIPEITNVYFNNPLTVVMWSDGTKTIVKANDDTYDPEKGLAIAISKKALGNTGKYYDQFKKYINNGSN